jgi:hypothetical protein
MEKFTAAPLLALLTNVNEATKLMQTDFGAKKPSRFLLQQWRRGEADQNKPSKGNFSVNRLF